MTLAAKFLEVQNELNLKLSPEWATKDWAYPDAMFTEATEAYNHLNWEWWRATDRKIDWNQVKLEWVDVMHFLLSEVISSGCQKEFETQFETQNLVTAYTLTEENRLPLLKDTIKMFVKSVIEYQYSDVTGKGDLKTVISYFLLGLYYLGLSKEEFYTLFIGKVCLNQLRWKNGYKKGIAESQFISKDSPKQFKDYYIKVWNGVEDNVWLAEYAATLDPNDAEFKSKLEAALDAKYKEVYELVWGR
jgi:dimeric dUTPase (all-alpha-NTP-PPase superfamily)